MITRFVKMHFKPELKKDFIILFYESVEVIKKFEGCLDVVLLEDADDESSMCTLSFVFSSHTVIGKPKMI